MLAHVALRVRDRAASERFYRTTLGTLGYEPTHERSDMVVWDDFAILEATPERPPTRNVHIGFVAPTREHVDAFHRAGLEAGYRDDGAPGERPQYKPDYYGSFLLDPDGNSAEAVHHGDCRRGGCIDHLWIRVRDLEAAHAFYLQIRHHTGLRPGNVWPQGRQLWGAWATFALIDDGRPVTENLHMAFPAPDRQTVHDFHAAAMQAGYESNGEPGERPQYIPGYYAAFVFDPDGNNIESVFRPGR
ncbi:MAG TPA: VOC family protein [Solirubrobacteraceae bacterium]|nr:VOC family protein [Solirubrobacteraceae bacterium]